MEDRDLIHRYSERKHQMQLGIQKLNWFRVKPDKHIQACSASKRFHVYENSRLNWRNSLTLYYQ